VRTPEEQRESFVTASLLVKDIDLDGIVDVVARKVVTRGISSSVSTSSIFYGTQSGGYPDRPDQVIQAEGVPGLDVELVDVNADRYPDLVVPSINTGLWAIIRYLTSKTVKIDIRVYPFSAGHRFTERPAMQHTVTVGLNLGGRADMQAVELFGDYNGDHRIDLAFATEPDELSIYLGTNSAKLFLSEPADKIKVRAFGNIELADFAKKGRNDLILFYPATKGHEGEIAVLFNQGPW
jgi:hypothetical protein